MPTLGALSTMLRLVVGRELDLEDDGPYLHRPRSDGVRCATERRCGGCVLRTGRWRKFPDRCPASRCCLIALVGAQMLPRARVCGRIKGEARTAASMSGVLRRSVTRDGIDDSRDVAVASSRSPRWRLLRAGVAAPLQFRGPSCAPGAWADGSQQHGVDAPGHITLDAVRERRGARRLPPDFLDQAGPYASPTDDARRARVKCCSLSARRQAREARCPSTVPRARPDGGLRQSTAPLFVATLGRHYRASGLDAAPSANAARRWNHLEN